MARQPYYSKIEDDAVETVEAEVVDSYDGEADDQYGGRDKLPYNDTRRVKRYVRKFGSVSELRDAINAYFADCEYCEPLIDKDGNTVLYKGEIVYKKPPTPPSTAGLALALGFPSRQSLVDFVQNDVLSQANDMRSQSLEEMGNPKFAQPEYRTLILQAYAIVEKFYEEGLTGKDTANGSKFALANISRRWNDKPALDLTLKGAEDKISADDAVKRLQALGFVKTRKPKESKKEDKK